MDSLGVPAARGALDPVPESDIGVSPVAPRLPLFRYPLLSADFLLPGAAITRKHGVSGPPTETAQSVAIPLVRVCTPLDGLVPWLPPPPAGFSEFPRPRSRWQALCWRRGSVQWVRAKRILPFWCPVRPVCVEAPAKRGRSFPVANGSNPQGWSAKSARPLRLLWTALCYGWRSPAAWIHDATAECAFCSFKIVIRSDSPF